MRAVVFWERDRACMMCVLICFHFTVRAEDKLPIWIRADGGQVALGTS